MYQSYRPEYPPGSTRSNHIPGLGSLASSNNMPTTSPVARMVSPEPGEILESTVTEERLAAMEAKMEKLEKDNDALRHLVAYLCKGVAKLSDLEASEDVPLETPNTDPADAFLEKLASEMSATTVLEVTEEAQSDGKMEDATASVEAGPTSSSTAVQHLSQKQEKLTKQLLAVQKIISTLQISFDSFRKEVYRECKDAVIESKYTSGELREVVQVSKEARKELKDLKKELDIVREDIDQFHLSELHERVKTAVNMRMFKENVQNLWEEMIRLTGITFPRNIEQIADTRHRLKVRLTT